MQNRSHILHGKSDLRLEDRPMPLPKEGELGFVGLCGSDVHQWADGGIGERRVSVPFVLGHEASARVLTSPDHSRLAPGTLLAVEPGIACAHCDQCKTGRYNLCRQMRFFSSLVGPCDGVLCHYKSHPIGLCHPLPSALSLEEGAVIEPLSVAVHALRRAKLEPGMSVLVCGAGPVGVLCALAAGAMGATDICITDINSERLSVASRLLPSLRTENVGKVSVKELAETGLSPPVVIECTGVPPSQTAAIELCERGGTVVLVGIAGASSRLPLHLIVSKELDVRGVFRYANCHTLALELAPKLGLQRLVSHRHQFEAAVDALSDARAGKGLKVLVDCRPKKE